MNRVEGRAVVSLAMIMACRMFGLFMILPFFSLYATELSHATPFLIGVALGAYGFTQACFQLPLGSLSDRIGRKKAISLGLVIFALGSFIAALSHSIYGIILGRALQGAGAVGSTILALAADLTRDEHRSKAMAVLGLTIALAFFGALILGPILNTWIHLSGIFWFICALALLALVLLVTVVPNPPKIVYQKNIGNHAWQALQNPNLLQLYFGIFCLHAILTAYFIALPLLLSQQLNLSQTAQTKFYLMILPLAFVLMTPFMLLAEKKRLLRATLIGAILVLITTLALLTLAPHSLLITSLSVLLFFAAFTWLEASLPSLVSKIAPIQRKGTAMGIYSTAQFAGIFAGGLLGGFLLGSYGISGVFLGASALGIAWLVIAHFMPEPPYLTTFSFNITEHINLSSLQNLAGVDEVALCPEQGFLHVKADKKIIDRQQLRKVIDESNLPR